jgi:hypothetical protein
MQAERWKQIQDLCQAALELAPEKRAAFLAQACLEDPQLRAEVQSLLDQQADSFLESAPVSAVKALSPGTKLGNFEIVQLLGRGGMGEVYRARDARLKREVAIKVLPAGLARDPDRIARFEREARAASALNHPNIVSVYDIGRDNDTYWIASELVRGDTLRRLIESGPLPSSKAVEIATQVATGLAAAHAAGLVHRDPWRVTSRPWYQSASSRCRRSGFRSSMCSWFRPMTKTGRAFRRDCPPHRRVRRRYNNSVPSTAGLGRCAARDSLAAYGMGAILHGRVSGNSGEHYFSVPVFLAGFAGSREDRARGKVTIRGRLHLVYHRN